MCNLRIFCRHISSAKRLWLVFGPALALVLIGFVLMRNDESQVPGVLPPVWRGIIPGKTKQWDVIGTMGKPQEVHKCNLSDDTWSPPDIPDRILTCLGPTLTYEYKEARPPRGSPATIQIRFRLATVSVIVEDVWGSPDESSPELLRRFVRDYGPPERVTWSERSPYVRAFLFCKRGVMVHANEVYASEIFYFVPVPLDKCLEEFKGDIATEDPFPNPPFVRTADPWPWLIEVK